MKRAKLNIQKLAGKSELMDIRVLYGDEVIKFNLYEELQISTDIIDHEIKVQPSHAAFISMVAEMINNQTLAQEQKVARTYAKLFKMYKRQEDETTGRANSKELTEQLVQGNKSYKNEVDDLLEMKHQRGRLHTCVKGFEQRGFLIQTLSANKRKEH